MSIFLDTTGRSSFGIALCARCQRKFPIDELVQDPNNGLWVCPADKDDLDPYRLPPRQTETAVLDHPRPDVDLEP